MKLEMYDIRAKLSEMFVNILPPLKAAAEKMVEEENGRRLVSLCDQVDSLLFSLHKMLPREVEVTEGRVIPFKARALANKVWHRNGHQFKLIAGGKGEKGPFAKNKGE